MALLNAIISKLLGVLFLTLVFCLISIAICVYDDSRD